MSIIESAVMDQVEANNAAAKAPKTAAKAPKGKQQVKGQTKAKAAPELNKSLHGYAFGSNSVFRAYTIAAIIATKCADFKDGRLKSVRAKGDTATLAKIIGESAWGTWGKHFTSGKMSVAGIDDMNVKSFEKGSYKTTPQVIAQMLSGIQGKPKTVSIKDSKKRDVTVVFRPVSKVEDGTAKA